MNIGAGIHLHALACLKSTGTPASRYKQTKSINQDEGPGAQVIAEEHADIREEPGLL